MTGRPRLRWRLSLSRRRGLGLRGARRRRLRLRRRVGAFARIGDRQLQSFELIGRHDLLGRFLRLIQQFRVLTGASHRHGDPQPRRLQRKWPRLSCGDLKRSGRGVGESHRFVDQRSLRRSGDRRRWRRGCWRGRRRGRALNQKIGGSRWEGDRPLLLHEHLLSDDALRPELGPNSPSQRLFVTIAGQRIRPGRVVAASHPL